MMRKWRAYLEREPWSYSAKLGIVGEDDDTTKGEITPGLVTGFVFKSFHRGGYAGNFETPSSGSEEGVMAFLRTMLSTAWDAGLRPPSVQDHTNEMKALRYHLEDMRRLAKVKPRAGG